MNFVRVWLSTLKTLFWQSSKVWEHYLWENSQHQGILMRKGLHDWKGSFFSNFLLMVFVIPWIYVILCHNHGETIFGNFSLNLFLLMILPNEGKFHMEVLLLMLSVCLNFFFGFIVKECFHKLIFLNNCIRIFFLNLYFFLFEFLNLLIFFNHVFNNFFILMF